MKKLKILELTNFSAGICGVWQRVKQESVELSKKGYFVKVFSSNAVKGSNEIAKPRDKLGKIQIQRFPFKKLGGESFMSWNFEEEALSYSPDIIIAHSYRHPHTLKALQLRDRLKEQGKTCKVFLVTHAPFIEKDITRSLVQSLTIKFYDFFIGPRTINKFDKIITITNWENPHLTRLGVKKEKIVCIPNGIPKEFFKNKPKQGKGILFLGRISPVKNLEILIKAMGSIKLPLDIVGPPEKEYQEKLLQLINMMKIKNVNFKQPVYGLKDKISLIDNHEIFVLPSKSEAMPQSLIEAMARGKIVISSATNGGKEIINNKNGFLFEIGNFKELANDLNKINNFSPKNKKRISKNAIAKAKEYQWNFLIKKLINLF